MKAQVFKSIFLFCLLHLAIISNAQIVYTNVNPDDTIQDLNFSYLTYQTYPLDLNNDGVTDFDLNQSYSKTALNSGTLCAYYHLNKICYAYPKNLNAIASDSIGGLSNSSLSIIEERLSWRDTSANHGYNNLANYYYTSIRHCPPASPATTSTGGNWYNQTDKYLGLKFVKGGLTYYGWARLQIASASSITVKDYAYNSIPNQPILAGETSCTTPTVNLTQSGSLSFCTGDSVTFTANGSGYQYQWKKGGVNISGATKQIYVAKTAGTYKCKVNNSCGSITSTGKTVTVPCRLMNEVFTEKLESPYELNIAPNPISNSTIISFSLDQSKNVSLNIFDLNGRLIKTLADNVFKEGEHYVEFNAENLNAGVYFLQMRTVENLQTKKLIVTK